MVFAFEILTQVPVVRRPTPIAEESKNAEGDNSDGGDGHQGDCDLDPCG